MDKEGEKSLAFPHDWPSGTLESLPGSTTLRPLRITNTCTIIYHKKKNPSNE